MKKILITGFEPFLKEAINPSQKLIELYADEGRHSVLMLPVSYRRAWIVLEEHLQTASFDFILMLGQAGGRRLVSLERTALNLHDSENADEDGDLRLQKPISVGGPEAFLSPLPLREWVQQMKAKNLPVEVSLSAGAFICNSIYYQVSEHFKNLNRPVASLFVHVPYLPEQAAGRAEPTPSLSLEMMKSTIDELLSLIEKHS